MKHLAPQRPIQPFVYHKYKANEKLYIVNCLRFSVLERGKQTDNIRGQLIITHGKPHHHASRDTLSRWVTKELQLARIILNVFNSHSCRAASASKTKQKGILLNDILRTGCWSKEHIFKNFYCKDILTSTIEKWTRQTKSYHDHIFRH